MGERYDDTKEAATTAKKLETLMHQAELSYHGAAQSIPEIRKIFHDMNGSGLLKTEVAADLVKDGVTAQEAETFLSGASLKCGKDGKLTAIQFDFYNIPAYNPRLELTDTDTALRYKATEAEYLVEREEVLLAGDPKRQELYWNHMLKHHRFGKPDNTPSENEDVKAHFPKQPQS
jgi:hypothetical protein